MRGHAAANIMPVLASNRVGTEHARADGPTLSMAAPSLPTIRARRSRRWTARRRGVRLASFDLDAIAEFRRCWGVFRDRRPELYGALMTIDGKTRSAAVPG